MRYQKLIGMGAPFVAAILAVALLLNACGDSSTQAVDPDNEIPADVMQIAQKHSMPFAPVEGGISKFIPSNTIYDPPYTNYALYAVTLLWGDLTNSSTLPVLYDWSGNVSINGVSTIDVVYEIDFEPGEDSVLAVNASSMAAWVSQAGDLDGLSFLIYLDSDITYITAPWLSVNTEQIDLELQFWELDDFARIYHVNNMQALVVVARRIWTNECPAGTMLGEWIRDDISGQSGNMSGVWYESNNDPAGLYVGTFEMSNSGAGSFEGSVSGYVTDEVIYLFNGKWFFDDPRLCPLCGTGHGKFQGVFYDMNSNVAGVMRGEFGYAADVNDNHLPMQGTWRQFCPKVGMEGAAQ